MDDLQPWIEDSLLEENICTPTGCIVQVVKDISAHFEHLLKESGSAQLVTDGTIGIAAIFRKNSCTDDMDSQYSPPDSFVERTIEQGWIISLDKCELEASVTSKRTECGFVLVVDKYSLILNYSKTVRYTLWFQKEIINNHWVNVMRTSLLILLVFAAEESDELKFTLSRATDIHSSASRDTLMKKLFHKVENSSANDICKQFCSSPDNCSFVVMSCIKATAIIIEASENCGKLFLDQLCSKLLVNREVRSFLPSLIDICLKSKDLLSLAEDLIPLCFVVIEADVEATLAQNVHKSLPATDENMEIDYCSCSDTDSQEVADHQENRELSFLQFDLMDNCPPKPSTDSHSSSADLAAVPSTSTWPQPTDLTGTPDEPPSSGSNQLFTSEEPLPSSDGSQSPASYVTAVESQSDLYLQMTMTPNYESQEQCRPSSYICNELDKDLDITDSSSALTQIQNQQSTQATGHSQLIIPPLSPIHSPSNQEISVPSESVMNQLGETFYTLPKNQSADTKAVNSPLTRTRKSEQLNPSTSDRKLDEVDKARNCYEHLIKPCAVRLERLRLSDIHTNCTVPLELKENRSERAKRHKKSKREKTNKVDIGVMYATSKRCGQKRKLYTNAMMMPKEKEKMSKKRCLEEEQSASAVSTGKEVLLKASNLEQQARMAATDLTSQLPKTHSVTKTMNKELVHTHLTSLATSRAEKLYQKAKTPKKKTDVRDPESNGFPGKEVSIEESTSTEIEIFIENTAEEQTNLNEKPHVPQVLKAQNEKCAEVGVFAPTASSKDEFVEKTMSPKKHSETITSNVTLEKISLESPKKSQNNTRISSGTSPKGKKVVKKISSDEGNVPGTSYESPKTRSKSPKKSVHERAGENTSRGEKIVKKISSDDRSVPVTLYESPKTRSKSPKKSVQERAVAYTAVAVSTDSTEQRHEIKENLNDAMNLNLDEESLSMLTGEIPDATSAPCNEVTESLHSTAATVREATSSGEPFASLPSYQVQPVENVAETVIDTSQVQPWNEASAQPIYDRHILATEIEDYWLEWHG